jgi:hypothetical protein
MYEQIFVSTKLVTPEKSNEYWQHLFYVSAWDAFLLMGNNEFARLFADGTKVAYGTRSGGYEPLGRVNGGPAWWSSWTKALHPAFELNGLPDENQTLNPSWPCTLGPSVISQTLVDDLNQVYLYQGTNNRLDVYDLTTGAVLHRITHNAGAYFTVMAWAAPGQVACMVKSTGAVRIIDYLQGREVVETGRVAPFVVGAYDCTHHNLVTLGADKRVRVYCREALPAAISAPEFVPVEVRGLKANLVRARLTGSDGEPCPGWWVRWELLGAGSSPLMGNLDKTVSLTDESGWAENFYFGPDDGSTGQNRVKVSVVF